MSRVGLDGVEAGFPGVDAAPFNEPRLLRAVCAGVQVFCVYAPSGRHYRHAQWFHKLQWLRLLTVTVSGDRRTVVGGDFNVQPQPIDVYDPTAWKRRNHGSDEERTALGELFSNGYCDVTRVLRPTDELYSWWSRRPGYFDQNRGMRIDLVLCTHDLIEFAARSWVDRAVLEVPRPSDHAPVFVDFDLPEQPMVRLRSTVPADT